MFLPDDETDGTEFQSSTGLLTEIGLNNRAIRDILRHRTHGQRLQRRPCRLQRTRAPRRARAARLRRGRGSGAEGQEGAKPRTGRVSRRYSQRGNRT